MEQNRYITTKYDKFENFRLVFYSVVAAAVLSAIPSALQAGYNHLLFTSVILFIAVVETFLRLDEGKFIAEMTYNAKMFVFLCDTVFIVGLFMLSSALVNDYSRFIARLSEEIQVPADKLAELFMHVERLYPVAVILMTLFVLLLIRGLVDRKMKLKTTIETRPIYWVIVHIAAIGICIAVLLLLIRIDKQYQGLLNLEEVVLELGNLPSSDPFISDAVDSCSAVSTTADYEFKVKAIAQFVKQDRFTYPSVVRTIFNYISCNPENRHVTQLKTDSAWIYGLSLSSFGLMFIYLFLVYSKVLIFRVIFMESSKESEADETK